MRILVEGVSILTMSLKREPFIDKGYIYLEKGVIRSVGRGEPPEDLEAPDLVIGGRGRLAIPALVILSARPSLYPFRLLPAAPEDVLSTMSRGDVQLFSAASLAGMALRGVSTILSMDPHTEPLARASEQIGLRVVSAPCLGQLGREEWEEEISSASRKWHRKDNRVLVAGSICDPSKARGDEASKMPSDVPLILVGDSCRSLRGERILAINPPQECAMPPDISIYTEGALGMWKPGAGLGFWGDASWSPYNIFSALRRMGHSPLDILASATVWASPKIGIPSGSIEPGRLGDIAVLDISQPPWWVPPEILDPLRASELVVTGIPRLETLIVGDEIVVDGGELLTAGRDLFSRAFSKASEILGRINAQQAKGKA